MHPESVNGISFCIQTNGKRVEKTKISINSIKNTLKNVNIPYEIIMSGDVKNFMGIGGVRTIDSADNAHRGLVAKLRNVSGLATDPFLNCIVFLDDDVVLSEKWATRLVEFSGQKGWNILGNKILLPDGSRFWDRAITTPHIIVPYDHPDHDPYLYQAGCFWIMRKDVYLTNQWDSIIPFYARENGSNRVNEDVELSQRLIEKGYVLSFDDKNLVWHNDDSYTEVWHNDNYVKLIKFSQTMKKDLAKKHMGTSSFAKTSKEFKDIIDRNTP